MVADYTTPALYMTKESVFSRGAATPPPYISLLAPVFSHELPAHNLESDESLCDLGLRVVRGAVQTKECEDCMMGQTPWRHPGGGGGMGQTPWRHPWGGGWDKHPGATPLPHPDEECASCRGKGGEG